MLGSFLRSRRLRCRSSRGTPLTQSAVAETSSVSVDLYARLERGTGIAVSVEAFARISTTLGLSHDESCYARNLLVPRVRRKTEISHSGADLCALVEVLTPHPAFVVNQCWEIVGANHAFRCAQDAIGSAADGNVVRTFFTCAAERASRPDWKRAADRMVAMLRMDFSTSIDDDSFNALIACLRTESRDFATRWDEHRVLSSATPVAGVVRCGGGQVRRYRSVCLTMSGWDDLELVVQVPHGARCSEFSWTP